LRRPCSILTEIACYRWIRFEDLNRGKSTKEEIAVTSKTHRLTNPSTRTFLIIVILLSKKALEFTPAFYSAYI